MPNLFELPGPRSGPNNFTSEYLLEYGVSYTVEAGTTLYASLPRMFWADHNWPTFTNHGTLWSLSDEGSAGGVAGMNVASITNTGTIVAEARNGNSSGVFVGSRGDTLSNSGSIYAIANGNATAVTHWDPGSYVENMGLIAAYAPSASTGGVGSALGVAMYNGGDLNNGAGGSILAEGLYATAIIFGRGSLFGDAQIRNDGRIEAFTTTPDEPSYGIRAGGVAAEIIRFVNNGVLQADVAWSSYGDHPDYAPQGMDRLTNSVAGSIAGRIETGRGNDSLVNAGSITGNVALGDEDDVFDTTTGTWSGAADLGWHNDLFLGSAGGDVATGNRGSDHLWGHGGNDLLLGGVGHDWIAGGAGNDGLYGELGEDNLITQGGDRAYGGDGDDVIQADDLSFALISGGAGYDTFRMAADSIKLDLGAAVTAGRLEGIERIALQDNQQLAIRAGNATSLAGGTLDIVGGSSSHLALVGAWTENAQTVRDGMICRSFTLGGETVFVELSVAVEIVASLPPGFSGLAPIAGGGAAPVAGSLPGGELADPVQTISGLHLNRAVVVDEGETWRSTDATVIFGYSLAHGLVNGGVIEMTNAASGYHLHTITNDIGYIANSGTIRGSAIGNLYVDAIHVRGRLENSGTVEAITEAGRALAVEVGMHTVGLVLENDGTISARSSSGTAIGAQIDYASSFEPGPVGTNHGRIEALGGEGTTGLILLTGGTFLNEGTIVAGNTAGSGATDATAVLLYNASFLVNRFVNGGSVSGTIAIRSEAGADDVINTGQIEGAIQLGEGSDIVENGGAIAGRIGLGTGSDVYLGAAATSGAEADGGGGIDLLVGGARGDRLEGGEGNDLLIGGGGADVLIGGAGADRFVYFSGTDSQGASADTIEDFESGIDRIDLGALAPTAVTLSVSAGITTVTAQTAEGAVTIRVSGAVTLEDIDVAAEHSLIIGTSASEVLVATSQGSEVRAGGGNDILLGTAGNDWLNGGAGTDVLYGGAGNDVFVVDTHADNVIERAGGGIDHVLAYANYTLPEAVEHLTLMTAAQATGNWLANRMRGTAGNDHLHGGGGNDVLIGGRGADGLSGGLGSDVFIYESTADSAVAAADRITGFEYGSDRIDLSAIPVLSISWARVLTQFDSYEEVTIETSDGPMTIRVDLLNIAPSGLSMSDFVLPVGMRLEGGPEADELTGGHADDSLLGHGGDDRLIGRGGNDTLDGGPGLDRMYGGAGNDTYVVADATDYAYEIAGEGTDRVHASVSHALRANVENLTLTGSSGLTGKGNELANLITGNSGANKLYGMAGDDRLYGGAGNDTLDGGLGLDRMYGGLGDDIYVVSDSTDYAYENAGEGIDRVYASVGHVLRANVEHLTLTGTANIHGKGNELGNVIVGNGGANSLSGLAGNDSLAGGGGLDTLDGGLGNDSISGGLDNDRLYGREGADVLKGDDGNDVLEGGTDRDRFYGGTGADNFVFRDGDFSGTMNSTADQIHDFSQADGDRIRLSLVDADATLAGDQAFSFIGTNGFSGTAGELRFQQIGANTFVQGDLNGDSIADFWIRLDGLHTLSTGDFVL